MTPTDPLVLVAAALLAVVATGRAARLVTHDSWPPILGLRLWWVQRDTARTYDPDRVHRSPIDPREWRYGWEPLATCPFCFAPYAAAVNLTWALLSGIDWTTGWGAAWWIVNAWAALSYLAAILVAFDEPAPVPGVDD